MCDTGIVYTEETELRATIPGVTSLWSYKTHPRGPERRSVTLHPDGRSEYWLERTDPLLNTILPGTGVSLVLNFGDPWAWLPRACVIGPVTQARDLRIGEAVHAVGACFPSPLAHAVFGVPAAELVDRIVPLADLWPRAFIQRLSDPDHCLPALRARLSKTEPIAQTAAGLIQLHAGRVSIESLAGSHGLSRREFGRRFYAAAGLPPKLFARITRFQALVHALLSTDVAQWAAVAPAAGFYDQAHMINEFRGFAGSPPTVFFQPRGGAIEPAAIRLRGRPSEWLRSKLDAGG
jgi:AraC-like DNA-binding protein